jgi:Mn-dependent DtxR family transcriptional regulator
MTTYTLQDLMQMFGNRKRVAEALGVRWDTVNKYLKTPPREYVIFCEHGIYSMYIKLGD